MLGKVTVPHSRKGWALLSQRRSFLGCLLFFMSPAPPLFSSLFSCLLSLSLLLSTLPSSPSRFPAVRNKQRYADLSPQMLPFLPSLSFPSLTCEHHPEWGRGRLPTVTDPTEHGISISPTPSPSPFFHMVLPRPAGEEE